MRCWGSNRARVHVSLPEYMLSHITQTEACLPLAKNMFGLETRPVLRCGGWFRTETTQCLITIFSSKACNIPVSAPIK